MDKLASILAPLIVTVNKRGASTTEEMARLGGVIRLRFNQA